MPKAPESRRSLPFTSFIGRHHNLSSAVLSIDDIYLTHASRQALAQAVHPLLQTRGVPGTHDLPLGQATLQQLTDAELRPRVAVPRFDKAVDDRADSATWPTVQAPVDVVLFEGWCVGATAQPAAELVEPINDLEQLEDTEATWRGYVNDQLAGDYRRLFAPIDRMIMLRAPSLQKVIDWRTEQEQKLAKKAIAQKALVEEAIGRRQMQPILASIES